MANNFFGCIGLTGGTDGSLDKIDGSILSDGDGAIVIDAVNNQIVHYTLSAGSGAAEASPTIISPDTNAGTKRWIMLNTYAAGIDIGENNVYLTQFDSGGTPVDVLKVDGTDDTVLNCKAGETIKLSIDESVVVAISGTGLSVGSVSLGASGVSLDGGGSYIDEFSTDGTLADNSDTAVPTEQAVRTYLGTKYPGRNLIVNGDFDIWQRGAGPFVATGYTADQWQMAVSGDTFSLSRASFSPGQADIPDEPTYALACTVTNVAGAATFAQLIHKIEDVRRTSNRTMTLTFYAKGVGSAFDIAIEGLQDFGDAGSADVRAISVTKVSLADGVYAKYTVPITFPAINGKTVNANSFSQINFWLSAGSDYNALTDSLGEQSVQIVLSHVQLEKGSIATDFEKKRFGDELAECQRFYQTGQSYMYVGSVASGSTYYTDGVYPVQMRAQPATLTTTTSGQTSFPAGNPAIGPVGAIGFRVEATANATAYGIFYGTMSASAEL